jgi:hypothetical protein
LALTKARQLLDELAEYSADTGMRTTFTPTVISGVRVDWQRAAEKEELAITDGSEGLQSLSGSVKILPQRDASL